MALRMIVRFTSRFLFVTILNSKGSETDTRHCLQQINKDNVVHRVN